jgi:hypothetical protein
VVGCDAAAVGIRHGKGGAAAEQAEERERQDGGEQPGEVPCLHGDLLSGRRMRSCGRSNIFSPDEKD